MLAPFNLWHRNNKKVPVSTKGEHFCFPTNFIFSKPDLPICIVATFLKLILLIFPVVVLL